MGKNLIVQECAAAEQVEKEEEIEIKSQAMAVLKQVIQEECKKMDDAEEQTNVAPILEEAVVEGVAQACNDVPAKTDEKVEEEEVKPSSEDLPIKNDENITEAKAVAAACSKCKGTGKTNMIGGARGFSFMKRQCKFCSSETTTQAAKAAKAGA